MFACFTCLGLLQVMEESWPAIKTLMAASPSLPDLEAIKKSVLSQPCETRAREISHESSEQQKPHRQNELEDLTVDMHAQPDLDKASKGMAGAAESLFMARMMSQ